MLELSSHDKSELAPRNGQQVKISGLYSALGTCRTLYGFMLESGDVPYVVFGKSTYREQQ